MKNILTENSKLQTFLPDGLEFVDGSGSRLYTEEKRVYFNFFNDSLRFLCGYDNETLNRIINNEISTLSEDPEQIYTIDEQVSDILRINAGAKYNSIIYSPENTYCSIVDNLIERDDQFILNLSSNYNIPESLNETIVELERLLSVEEDFKRDQYTYEGWSVKKIKKVFNKYKKRIAGLIINPVLLDRGIFLDEETCNLLVSICKRYRIPIIWDESLSCFFRSTTFYLVNQYSIEPEFLVINSKISESESTHIIIIKKGVKKKYKDFRALSPEKNATALIIIHSLLYYISQYDLVAWILRVSKRLTKKLEALSHNIINRFQVESRGLIVFIEFENEKILERFKSFSKKERILVLNNDFNAVLLDPQITISTRSVDTLIQVFDSFFKIGLRLPND